jgi:hypothetical protein
MHTRLQIVHLNFLAFLVKSPAIIVRIQITIFSPKHNFRPQFLPQTVADVETRRYSPYVGSGEVFLPTL